MNENMKKVVRSNKYVVKQSPPPKKKMYIVGIAGITNNCSASE